MGSRDYLKLGDWNAICDLCGFKYKASELRKRWDGFMVCQKDWEPRPPQEYIKGIKEDFSVPFSRPMVTDRSTTGYVQALAGTTYITQASIGLDNRVLVAVLAQLYGIHTQGGVTIDIGADVDVDAIVTVAGAKTAGVATTIINNSSATVVETD